MVQDDEDMDFGKLFEASSQLPSNKPFLPGERIKGKVVSITADTVFIDYGAKSEGWADLEEFLDEKGEVGIKPESEVELTFLGYGPSGAQLGSCLRKVSGGSGEELLRKAFESGIPIEGTITGINKGGLQVSFSGTLAFCPFSQIDLGYCERPEALIGTTQKFKVIQFEEDEKNIVVSRRAELKANQEAMAAKTRERLAVGEVFQGRVTRLTDFGAFVDLGAIEGLIHISEISRSPVKDPADHLEIGQDVAVQILRLESDEKGMERISLSIKALEPDPWETGLGFAEGDTITGTVRNLATYGAFVEVAPGVEGLVHISEISHKHIQHPKEKLQKGQEITVKVLEINVEQRRISLSIKEVPTIAEPDPFSQETIRTGNVIRRRVRSDPTVSPSEMDNENQAYETAQSITPSAIQETFSPLLPKVGLIVKGIVCSIKPYGFFIDLPELGSKQRGLLHISQLAVSEKSQPQKGLKEGDEISTEIIRIDEQGRISLSQKSVLQNQDQAEYNQYRDRIKETGKLGTMADLFKTKKKGASL